MTTTIEKFVEGFPYPTIRSISGLPTYETIAELHELLNVNASSIQTNLGGGAHGLLVLTATPAVFNTICPTTPYVILVNPGAPAVIPAASTGPQIVSI